jgi:hypothetical protein
VTAHAPSPHPSRKADRTVVLRFAFGHVDWRGLVVRRRPTSAEIARAWRSVLAQRRGLQWGVGDLYNLFADGFADVAEVSDVLDLAEISLATAQRYGHTCRRFVRCDDVASDLWPFRRRDLSFSHHSAVAGLIGKSEAATALAVSLLDRALADRTMSAEDLEDAVKAFRASGAGEAGAASAERAASEGSPAARLERLHGEASRVLDGLPSDYRQEREIVRSALGLLASAWESARNREAGGAPIQIPLAVSQEVDA